MKLSFFSNATTVAVVFLFALTFPIHSAFALNTGKKNSPMNSPKSSTEKGSEAKSASASAENNGPRKSKTALSSNELTWNLLESFNGKSKTNVFLSPLSISIALNIAYKGSRGAVREDAFSLLHELTAEDIEQLKRLQNEKEITFKSANAVWTDSKSSEMKEPDANFKNLMKTEFQAGFHYVPFPPAEKTEMAINGWVSDQTNSMIKNLVTKSDIENSTVVVVNAVYFKGNWENAFQAERTSQEPFFGSAKKSNVPFMNQTEDYRYNHGADYETLAIPYAGGNVELAIVLPTKGTDLSQLQRHLTPKILEASFSDSKTAEVHLRLPKLDLQWGAEDLMPPLKKMGLVTRGDFTPLGCDDLELKKVIHKTAFKMDEKGSEAAAATAVIGMPGAGMPVAKPKPIDMFVNRPFLFVIRQPKSGQWLFIGKIENL